MASQNKQITLTVKVPKTWDRKTIRRNFNTVDGVQVQTIKLPVRPGGGVEKGRRNEREFARQLSLWWTRGEDEHVFSHRAGSGGRKRDKQGDSSHGGDIQAEKESGRPFTNKYCVELKFTKDATGDLWSFYCYQITKKLADFWHQTVEAALPYRRMSLLVIRTNQRPPIVITDDTELVERYQGWFREIDGEIVGVFALEDMFNDFGLVSELDPGRGAKPRSKPRKRFARI